MTAKIDCSQSTKYTKGFYDRNAIQIYIYDVNGNLVFDPDKQISIKYNHLNLPYEVDFGDGKALNWLYDATGIKLRMTAKQGGTEVSKRDYIAELEYQNDSLETVYHVDGRAVRRGEDWEYQYCIKDHVNNTRVVFRDDGNGEPKLLTKAAYYPFGMQMDTFKLEATPLYRYLFNGIERNEEFGLNIDMALFRTYDPSTIRWWQVDPKVESFAEVSSYSGMGNNPIIYSDILGDSIRIQIGEDSYFYYTPGTEYSGDDKFVSKVVSSLNTINTSEAGSEVLNVLSKSEDNFTFQNVVSKDKEGNPVGGVRFVPLDGGGGNIEAGESADESVVAHELFHGYQQELGMMNFDRTSTAVEVGAYLFQEIVALQAGIPSAASISTNEYGKKYDDAHRSLLFDGFNEADYASANLFFKFSSHNASGVYSDIKKRISYPNPPIAKFLPVFK